MLTTFRQNVAKSCRSRRRDTARSNILASSKEKNSKITNKTFGRGEIHFISKNNSTDESTYLSEFFFSIKFREYKEPGVIWKQRKTERTIRTGEAIKAQTGNRVDRG